MFLMKQEIYQKLSYRFVQSKYYKRPKRFLNRWLRFNWPRQSFNTSPHSPQVAVGCVNYNTYNLIASLIFSLCRIVGRHKFKEILVVDNHSTDGSVELLKALEKEGIIRCIYNQRQKYHGPGLNQGINYLARLQNEAKNIDEAIEYLLILDSDVIVLRPDLIDNAVNALRQTNAALCGQIQPNERITEGYAHVSSLLIDPIQVWRRGISPFEEDGIPALALQQSLLARGLVRCDFPFRSQGYLLHLGSGTLKVVREEAVESNNIYSWKPMGNYRPNSYHGEPAGAYFHEEFEEVYNKEVPEKSIQAIVNACKKSELIPLNRPFEVTNNFPTDNTYT
jgi:glycosyltransferase involved in cell wall biosynthesis